MKNIATINLLVSLLLATAAMPGVVSAANEEVVLEEVVVTAQRREQSLQDVPVAVTALSADAITRQNIKSATDYLMLTPNVSYTEDGQFGKRGAGVSIRGVNNLVSGENATIHSIGVYLDEFSVASVPNQFANPQLPDMQRIEVLRGPQGTFFGRNAVGGALNLTTQNPQDDLHGQITLGGESYDDAGGQWNVTGMLNVPVSDSFKLRGVINVEDNSGYVKNICDRSAGPASCPTAVANGFNANGASDSGHEYLSARLKGLWDVNDRTSVMTTLIYADEEQGHDENVPSGFLDLDSVDTLGVQTAVDPGTGFWPNNRNKLSHDLNERNDLETTIVIVNVTHEINDTTTLKWITGAIDSEFERLFDNDLVGGLDALARTNSYEGESYSTELRIESLSDSLDWVFGVMYSKDKQSQENAVRTSSRPGDTIGGVGFLPPFPEGLGLALNTKSASVKGLAAFGDFTFHLSDQLDVIIGGRFSRDDVRNKMAGNGIGPTCCFPGSPGYPGGPGFDFFQSFANSPRPVASGSESFSDFAPRAGVRYQINDDVGIYGMISKGYKAGGTSTGNNTNADGNPAFTVEYDEEVLWNYEIGLKSEFLDNRLRINAAAFYLAWDDMQFESFRFLTPGDLSSNFEQTINIDESNAVGFEVEFQALLSDNFSLSGALGIIDTEIEHDAPVELTGGYSVSLDGLELPKAPELSFNLAAQYFWNVGGGDAWIRVEYIHRDGQFSDIEGLTNRQTRGPSPNQGLIRPVGSGQFPYLSPDFDVFNLRMGWENENWSAQLFVQNLGDEEYYTGTQENFGASGIRLRPHPRIIGGSVSYNF